MCTSYIIKLKCHGHQVAVPPGVLFVVNLDSEKIVQKVIKLYGDNRKLKCILMMYFRYGGPNKFEASISKYAIQNGVFFP